jgi:hypothetical protein
MIRFAWCPLVVALGACPPRQAPQPPPQPPLQGAGCPSANGVFLASYATQDPSKGRTGWVMPLQAPAPDSLASGADIADYKALDDATAKSFGAPDVPAGNLWLVSGNVSPCLIKPGNRYIANIENHVAFGVELDGCPAPPDPEATGLVLVSQDTPSSCQFQAPQSVAARLGDMTGPKTWQKPEKDAPIPPELAALVPAHDCTAPGCEKLWAVGEIKVADKPVAWAAAVNWLAIGDPAAVCDWKAERWSGFFVPGADGAPMQVTEGVTHPLALSSVLVDHSGARVLLAEGPGEYATYDLSPAGAKLGHLVTWMTASDDDWASIDHLGPLCEPDAKPQSPYP